MTESQVLLTQSANHDIKSGQPDTWLVSMTLEKRTKTYLIAAHMGALATASVLLTFGLDMPDFVKGLSIGLMIVPLVVMLIRPFRDEYVETLWQSGTSLAFAAVIVGFLALPMLEGFYDGFTGTTDGPDIPADVAAFAAIVAFYIGFHFRWLRGLR